MAHLHPNYIRTILLQVLAGMCLISISISCRSTGVPVKLTVSERHRQALKDLSKPEYTKSELPALFSTLSEKSDKLCPMHFGDEEFDEAFVETFATGLRLKKPKKEKWFDKVVPSLMVGCFNFFEMNDQGVRGTFETVAKLIPEKKECYSVGLMQPYFMHAALGCEKLTMLDINWRIHHAHSAITELFIDKKFAPGADDKEPLKDVPVAWIARFDRKPQIRPKKTDLSTFCVQEEQAACEQALKDFQAVYSRLKGIDFQLAFIHEASLEPQNTSASVVFVSNALDLAYTSANDFKSMMSGFNEKLPQGKNIYMIYQAGTSKDIGVYKIGRAQQDDEKVTVTTICRDDFRWSEVYVDKGKPYKIYLDKVSQNRKAPRCSAIE